jgi:hypothetical protein
MIEGRTTGTLHFGILREATERRDPNALLDVAGHSAGRRKGTGRWS